MYNFRANKDYDGTSLSNVSWNLTWTAFGIQSMVLFAALGLSLS